MYSSFLQKSNKSIESTSLEPNMLPSNEIQSSLTESNLVIKQVDLFTENEKSSKKIGDVPETEDKTKYEECFKNVGWRSLVGRADRKKPDVL